MAAIFPPAHRSWSAEMDAEGHRVYKVVYRVETTDPRDGPATVLQTPGQPAIGSIWLIDNDVDVWAFRLPTTSVKPVVDAEPNTFWDLEMTFSTPGSFRSGAPGAGSGAGGAPPAPARSQRRCNDTQVESPLLEPPRISGGLIKDKVEATTDRFGYPIVNSAHEQIRGAQVEFDEDRDTVRIEMNVPALDLTLLSRMKNSVNDRTLWGFPRRCVKLSNYTWEVLYYGQCFKYYRLVLDFETHAVPDPLSDLPVDLRPVVSGFDRNLLDEGRRALSGKWRTGSTTGTGTSVAVGGWELVPVWDPDDQEWVDPNPYDPSHFNQVLDRQGNPTTVVLDGLGQPLSVRVEVNRWWWIRVTNPSHIEYYPGLAWFGRCSEVLRFVTDKLGEDWEVWGPYGSDAQAKADGPLQANASLLSDCPSVSEKKPGNIHVEKFPERNFLLLGIPTSF